jgi:hypothetical protein
MLRTLFRYRTVLISYIIGNNYWYYQSFNDAVGTMRYVLNSSPEIGRRIHLVPVAVAQLVPSNGLKSQLGTRQLVDIKLG